jgi:hypothetical protein
MLCMLPAEAVQKAHALRHPAGVLQPQLPHWDRTVQHVANRPVRVHHTMQPVLLQLLQLCTPALQAAPCSATPCPCADEQSCKPAIRCSWPGTCYRSSALTVVCCASCCVRCCARLPRAERLANSFCSAALLQLLPYIRGGACLRHRKRHVMPSQQMPSSP